MGDLACRFPEYISCPSLPVLCVNGPITDVCSQLSSKNERIWQPGCSEASLKINGGSHHSYPPQNLNRDPNTFWHSTSGGGGGVVINFTKEVKFSSVKIGARKERGDWNDQRYRNVEVLVDGKLITKTSSNLKIPADFIIPIQITEIKGKSLELKWPKVSVQIATLEVLYTEEDVCSQLTSNNERIWKPGCPEASLKINGGSH